MSPVPRPLLFLALAPLVAAPLASTAAAFHEAPQVIVDAESYAWRSGTFQSFADCPAWSEPGPCLLMRDGSIAYRLHVPEPFPGVGLDHVSAWVVGVGSPDRCAYRLIAPDGAVYDEGVRECPELLFGKWPGITSAVQRDAALPAGTYELQVSCVGTCDLYLDAVTLLPRLYHVHAWPGRFTTSHDLDPPRASGLQPTLCVEVAASGSRWFRTVDLSIDWGDGSPTESWTATLGESRSTATWKCHAYVASLLPYQVCVMGTDGRGEPSVGCGDYPGGIDW